MSIVRLRPASGAPLRKNRFLSRQHRRNLLHSKLAAVRRTKNDIRKTIAQHRELAEQAKINAQNALDADRTDWFLSLTQTMTALADAQQDQLQTMVALADAIQEQLLKESASLDSATLEAVRRSA